MSPGEEGEGERLELLQPKKKFTELELRSRGNYEVNSICLFKFSELENFQVELLFFK